MLNVLRLMPFRTSGITSIRSNENEAPPTPYLPDHNLDETIEDVNKAAGKLPVRQSPRKRKAIDESPQSQSAAKRRSSERLAQGTPSQVTAANNEPPASRLKSGKSNVARHPINRNDPFALPAEDMQAPVPHLKDSQKPVHKAMRRLAKRTANPSPLKGRGVIKMPTAGVDLIDSPENKVMRLARQVDRLPPDYTIQARYQRPSDQQNPSKETEDTVKPAGKSPGQKWALRTGPGTPTRKRSTRKAQPSVSEANRGNGDEEESVFVSVDEDEDVAEHEDSPAEAAVQEADGPPNGQPQDIAENAARRIEEGRKGAEQRQEDTRLGREQVANLVRGIEEVAKLHGCKASWEEMLFNANEVLDQRSDYGAESRKGKKMCRRIEYLKNEFRHLNDSDAHVDGFQAVSLVTQIHNLKQRLTTFQDIETGDGKREMNRKARDLHQLIVPLLAFLLKTALRTRQDHNTLSLQGYEELSPLLTLSHQAADMACLWYPRPSGLEDRVKSRVRRIRSNLGQVSGKYRTELDRLRWPIENKRRTDALEERQKRDLRDWAEYEDQRVQRMRDMRKVREDLAQSRAPANGLRSMLFMQERQTQQVPTSSQDLAVSTEAADHAHCRGARLSREIGPAQRGVPVASSSQQVAGELIDIDVLDDVDDSNGPRPIPRRQQTEDIPGPVPTSWLGKQVIVLLSALQEHTGEFRFQKIYQQYGDQLGDRSLDEIVSQAQFMRASLATRLETELDATWNWLRSVPSQ